MYILETEQSFDSAHFLSGYDGRCKNIHGHHWRVIARLASENLEKEGQIRGMVIDFADFKKALGKHTSAMDHTLIIEEGSLRPITLQVLKEEGFALTLLPFRPTAENFSRHFFEALRADGIPVSEVTVCETPKNRATYREVL